MTAERIPSYNRMNGRRCCDEGIFGYFGGGSEKTEYETDRPERRGSGRQTYGRWKE